MPSEHNIELGIVMPVYNEGASVKKVSIEWFSEVSAWTENFRFIAVDDGSTDDTPSRLQALKESLGDRFCVLRQENQGHGQACLNGYRHAFESGCEWILQIDSDGQCDPRYFHELWGMRDMADVVYGLRVKRDDGFDRNIVSLLLRLAILLRCGALCPDPNVPYRLMKSDVIKAYIERIPKSFQLVNVALAVLLKKAPEIRHGYVPIRFRARYGGKSSTNFFQVSSKGAELFFQLRKVIQA